MHLTGKSRYGLKIMLDLANLPDYTGKRRDLAERQGLSLEFMDQVLLRLRAGGLVKSYRGRNGGLGLARAPEDISIWEIFAAVEDVLYPVRCLPDPVCGFEDECMSYPAWVDVIGTIKKSLSDKSLASLLPSVPLEARVGDDGVHVCKGPVYGGRQVKSTSVSES